VPSVTQPGDTQPDVTQPNDTQPGDTQPGVTQPGDTQPDVTNPVAPGTHTGLSGGQVALIVVACAILIAGGLAVLVYVKKRAAAPDTKEKED
jgi:hypothetical protein